MSGYNELTAWIGSFDYNIDVTPIELTMFGRQYNGASYTFIGHYEKGMIGVNSGEHKEGEEYRERRLYFLGYPPKEYLKQRRDKICFIFNGETYYISAYTDKARIEMTESPTLARYHPFGASFMLGVWPTEKFGEIDKYEHKKYQRIPIEIKSQE